MSKNLNFKKIQLKNNLRNISNFSICYVKIVKLSLKNIKKHCENHKKTILTIFAYWRLLFFLAIFFLKSRITNLFIREKWLQIGQLVQRFIIKKWDMWFFWITLFSKWPPQWRNKTIRVQFFLIKIIPTEFK